jgi:hypothetical protein
VVLIEAWPSSRKTSSSGIPALSHSTAAVPRSWCGRPSEVGLVENGQQVFVQFLTAVSDWRLPHGFPVRSSRVAPSAVNSFDLCRRRVVDPDEGKIDVMLLYPGFQADAGY